MESSQLNEMELQNSLNKVKSEEGLSIKSFFDETSVFVTGGTGFVGKVLIEKLLRCCTGICNIYILIRMKKGQSSEMRFKDYLRDQVFDRIRLECPELLMKLHCISGDVTQPYLGICDMDRQLLIENCNIVFNSAANVKFNEPITEAANLNTMGPHRVLEICSKMMHLKSVVHVSTAFCNPGEKTLEEKVYMNTPISKDCFLTCLTNLPKKFIDSIENFIKGSHPNTYTFTKSMAEHIVCENGAKIPICIVRPSIVTASVEDPVPGFVDNIQAMNGFALAIGKGSLKVMIGNRNYALDIIPVDTVARTMICAAWQNGIEINSKVKIYNCVSGKSNPIILEQLRKLILKWSRRYPSKYITSYPSASLTTSPIVWILCGIFIHLLPAFLYDCFLRLTGHKPFMVRFCKKFNTFGDYVKFVTLRNWNFTDQNYRTLANRVKLSASDNHIFSCDIANLDWDSYIEHQMLGLRKYVLKDDANTLQAAQKKLTKLYWAEILIKIILIGIFCKLFATIFL